MLSPIKRFSRLLKQYKSEIRQIYIYALFIGMVNLALPLGIQAIINFLLTGEPTTTWIVLVGFVLSGIAITGILQVLQMRVVENIQQDLFARSGFEFAYRIPEISVLGLDKVHAPELVNRFFDTLTIQKGLPKILIDFSLAVFQIGFGLILLAIYSPFFIILGLALAFILWIIFRVTGPRGLETSLKESKYKYKLVHWLEEVARVNRSFKIFAGERFHLNQTDKYVKGYLESRQKHFGVLISQFGLFIGFKVIVAAGLLLLGGYLVFQEQMDIGQFVAAEIIIILIINSVEKVLKTIDSIYDVLTALDKIGYVTDLDLDNHSGITNLQVTQGLSVRANDITFGFPDEKTKILENVSFEVASNEKVVLSGESGSGKSVLLSILEGLYEVESGQLYINNVPFSNYDRVQLYKQLGVALPNNQIFEGSFRDNILLGRKIDDRVLAEMLQLLGLAEYLDHQPKGIKTLIDSGGRRLPRSIIQKIIVARTLIGEPKLLLIEDPLQFIEEGEKKRIIDYIMDEQRNWTVLVVSDFHYWKEKSDNIIELKKK